PASFSSPRSSSRRAPRAFPTRRSSDLQLERAIRDDLVRVHVRRRAGAALDHVDAEVLVMAPGLDLVTGLHDRLEHVVGELAEIVDRKSTRLNSSHVKISYAVFCLKKKK